MNKDKSKRKMRSPFVQKTLEIAKKKGVICPKDLKQNNIPPRYLNRLYHQGYFRRISHGLYELKSRQPGYDITIAEVSKKIPFGVICLLSALRFHGLTTQSPFEVWIAIDRKAWRPVVGTLPVRIIRLSGAPLKSGIQKRTVEGIKVKIYNPAKTVADCFKYRNKIGKDVAIEALKDCLNKKLCSVDELWKYAKICRVANVMRPYLEAVV
jgi:predicted transcriptional regulator of viral defense system